MRKRDKKKEHREIAKALAMFGQIGISMMTCLAVSLGIGYYLDKLWAMEITVNGMADMFIIIIMMVIGILAALRSMLVLTGVYTPGSSQDETKESEDEGSKKKSD